MHTLIVYAHQEPNSFNAALRDLAVDTLTGAGHTVEVADLYTEGFNPIAGRHDTVTVADPDHFKLQREQQHAFEQGGFAPELQREIDRLMKADTVIFQSPLWWFSLPAILKGWVDRVFAMGPVYGGGRLYDEGILKGKRAMLSLTTGGPEAIYGEGKLNGSLKTLLYHIHHGMFYFVGMDVLPPFVAFGAARASDEERAEYLSSYRQRLLELDRTDPIFGPGISGTLAPLP